MRVRANLPAQAPKRGIHAWLEERIGVDAIWESLFQRKIPYGVNLFYTLGFVSLALFVVQAMTGAVLAMYYVPSPDHAYDSIQYIQQELPYGSVIRGIHHWAASAMIALVVLHLLAVFSMAAYKYPREMTWVVGVVLLLITLGFGFTGYLLPWDEKAYWATTVGTNMAGTVPAIGGTIVRVLRGGAELGALTLTRFYAGHVLLLPMLVMGGIALHVFLVIRQGVSVPPGLWDRSRRERLGRESGPAVRPPANLTPEEYHREYEQFKARGRPFFPDLIVEDAIVTVVVVLGVVAVSVLAGVPLEGKADPTNTSYIPRPEWYFMFLFELLKYFPGALEWLGAIVLPLLLVVALLALPFVDRRSGRAPRSRPISLAAMVVAVGAVLLLTVSAVVSTPPAVVEEQGVRLSAAEIAGRQLVLAQNCNACHVVAGHGTQLGPDLDGIGSRRDAAFIHTYVEHPRSLNPNSEMPDYIPPLSHEQVEEITKYLLTLKK